MRLEHAKGGRASAPDYPFARCEVAAKLDRRSRFVYDCSVDGVEYIQLGHTRRDDGARCPVRRRAMFQAGANISSTSSGCLRLRRRSTSFDASLTEAAWFCTTSSSKAGVAVRSTAQVDREIAHREAATSNKTPATV